MNIKTDIVIVGCGVSGLFCALSLPKDKEITIISKEDFESSDSFLAQGGICVLHDDKDFQSFFDDTMRAGHYENKEESVEIMINSSRDIINELIEYGVDFASRDGELLYAREGAHTRPRILYHEDITGKEITSKLLAHAMERKNINMIKNTTMIDLINKDNTAYGVVCVDKNGGEFVIEANFTILATGGIGGLYEHSTNFPHLTGDSLYMAIKYGIKLKNINYVQIHPTTLYSKKPGRRFLISESVRGAGAILLDKDGNRFADELLPRDILTQKILEQMKKDNRPYVNLSMETIEQSEIKGHFPNIYKHCLEEGYDVTKEPIPVVPAQHYFMGGIEVNKNSKTSMDRLYAVGETACNGVHGKNRLASNSLLESIVFAKRSAIDIANNFTDNNITIDIDFNQYKELDILQEEYKNIVRKEIERVEANV